MAELPIILPSHAWMRDADQASRAEIHSDKDGRVLLVLRRGERCLWFPMDRATADGLLTTLGNLLLAGVVK